jgi:putative phosphoribosyl transferase
MTPAPAPTKKTSAQQVHGLRSVHSVQIGQHALQGELALPEAPTGLVVFAHGSGSSRHSPRNIEAAHVMHQHQLATLLFDLLQNAQAQDRSLVFDIPALAERVLDALDWVARRDDVGRLRVGLFGASTGAAAALVAATLRPAQVMAVVCRGGRPDLAQACLPRVAAATLLLVGSNDAEVLRLNRQAMRHLSCEKRLEIVPGATHLFEEPGALDVVTHQAADWFVNHLANGARRH